VNAGPIYRKMITFFKTNLAACAVEVSSRRSSSIPSPLPLRGGSSSAPGFPLGLCLPKIPPVGGIDNRQFFLA
jgi:hypothetical protein